MGGTIERELMFRVAIGDAPQAIRTLGSVMEAVRRMNRETEVGERAVAQARSRIRADLYKDATRIERELANEAKKAQRAAVLGEKEAAREKQRASQQAERERQRAVNDATKAAERAMRQQVRDFERAEKEKTAIARRESKMRADEQRALDRAQQASASRQLMINAQRFRQEERATLQRARDEAFNRGRLYRGLGGAAVEGMYGGARAIGAVGGAALRVAGGVGHALGMQESYDVGDIFAQRMQIQQTLRYVEQESGGKVGAAGAARDIARASKMTGISQREILRAVDKASEMGDPTRGVQNIGQIAKEAKAYGADITDIMTLRQQAVISAGQSGTELTDADLTMMVAKMGALGKTGTMRISDLAKRSPELFSRWAASGQGLTGGALDELIGFTEVARSASGGSAKTTTSVKQVQDAILKNEKKVDTMLGPHTVRDASTGAQNDPIDIMMRVLAKAGPTGLSSIVSGKGAIFDTKAMSAINPFVAAMAGQKTEAGRLSAMRAMLAKASNTAGISGAQTDKEFAGAMDTDASRLAVAKERIRQSLETTLVPVFEKLASKLPSVVAMIESGLTKVGPLLDKLGTSLGNIWRTLGPVLTPIAKEALSFAVEHPVLATFGAGALKTGGKAAAIAAGRYLGESLVNKVPGIGGVAARTLIGAGGNALAAAGSQPVYVTGAAPGIFGGGGGGGGGIPGAAPGQESVYTKGAKVIGGGIASVALPALATLGAVTLGSDLASDKKWGASEYAKAIAMAPLLPMVASLAGAGYIGEKVLDVNRDKGAATDAFKKAGGGPNAAIKAALSKAFAARDDSMTAQEMDAAVFGTGGWGGFGPKEKTPQEKWEDGDRGAFAGVMGFADQMMGKGGPEKLADDPSFDKFFTSMTKAADKADELAAKLAAAGDNASKIKNPPAAH